MHFSSKNQEPLVHSPDSCEFPEYSLPSVAWTTDDHRSQGVVNILPVTRGCCAVSESDDELKRSLECLRLASDLVQLAHNTLNPDLKAHCLHMARIWSDRAEQTSD
jgi:hypothetical protein